MPFSEPLEPLRPDEEPEFTLTTAALLLPATPAPKPKKSAKRFAYSEAFEAFWLVWPGSGVKSTAYEQWIAQGLDEDETKRDRVMQILEAQVAHKTHQRRTTGFAPSFSHAERWIRDAQWENKLEGMTPVDLAPKANPYEQQPWGPIWTQAGFPENEIGVMNFAAKLEADPYEARDAFRNNGFLAAVTLAWTRRRQAV